MFYKLNLRCKKKKFDKKKDISTYQSLEYNLPLVNAKNGDNGVMYYGRFSDWESADYCIDIVNDGAVSTGNVYPQPQETGVLYNAYLIKGIDESFHNEFVIIYIAQALQKSIKLKYGYDNKATWEKVKNNTLVLPSINDLPCTKFMESYIRELEQERIRELEQERIRELDAYLKATDLNDYELTLDEKKLEENFFKSGGRFKKFKIGELFDIHPTKSYGYTNTKLFDSIGNTPVVVNSSKNNGIGGRVNLAPTEKANTITFSDTTTAESIFVQDEMFIGYSHVQGLYPYKDEWSKRSLMYFATLFRKNAIQMKFDYANKFNRSKASDMFVLLPVNNLDQVAFDFMEHYIEAVEKICIRSIVDWKDKIIETTKTMLNQVP